MSYGEIDNNEALYDGTPVRTVDRSASQHLANTEQFNNNIIETLIDRQRQTFNDAGTSEDVLDILKSKWRKNL
jgi:hypothetical protein